MAQRRQKASQKSRARSPQQTVASLRRTLTGERHQRRAAIQQQQATAEILKVISQSQTDIRPVFQAIAERAARLCEAGDAQVFVVNGEKLELVAHSGKVAQAAPSQKIEPGWATGRAVMEGAPVQVKDVLALPREFPTSQITSKPQGVRTVLALPLMLKDAAVGAITLRRREVRPFSDKQIALLKTFADQAVIAIENVRLFNETKEALERQTAISEVLRVISDSPTDVKPVLDAVAVRAAKICDAFDARIWLVEGDSARLAAGFGDVPMPVPLGETLPLDRGWISGRAILERTTLHIEDSLQLSPDEYPITRKLRERSGLRTTLSVPLMRESRALGAILLRRKEVRPFTDKQIALLKTFADQAAIAIENVRLFNETKEALERQTATSEILRVISSFPSDVQPVFDAIAAKALELCGGTTGWVYTFDGKLIHIAAAHSLRSEALEVVRQSYPMPPSRGGATARAILSQTVVYISNVGEDADYKLHALARAAGYSSIVAVPMLLEGKPIGVITVTGAQVGAFSPGQIGLLQTFADQAVIAIQNVRLFREIQEKSAQLETVNRQLEIADKHKSEFLANMSHELRTPLNAIIGFSEAMMEQMFGELNEKQLDYQKDINDSGKHLLSLINDILDLSKIEAGRMELELSTFHLPTAVSNAVTLMRERAQRHGIALGVEIDERLGEFEADERKVKQILLNLLSNAVKFTPDGGRVDVSAKLDTDKVEIAVKDSGVGMTPEDQVSLFEEFRQLGKDSSRKAEGTGLGLALTKRLVELHGGLS